MNHFIDDNGVPMVKYTGLGKDGKFGIFARSLDGLVSYTGKDPVLTGYDHDGHVWKEGDTWYMITSKMYRGARPGDKGDAVMLWTSPDLKKWQERGEIFTQPKYENSSTLRGRIGFMEFPYLINFGTRDVLMLGSNPARYWIGLFDREQLRFIPDTPEGLLFDYSNPFHCFNPLCVDNKGSGGKQRRIMMALYMNAGGEYKGLPWSGVHVIPRVIELEGNRLRQDPVPEISSLRSGHYLQKSIKVVPGRSDYLKKTGDCLEILADFEPGSAARFGMKVKVSPKGDSFVRICFDTATNEFIVDGNVHDTHKSLDVTPGQGRPSYILKGQPVRMHVFLDRQLIEVFINGQTWTTSVIDRNPCFNGIDLFTEEGYVKCTRLDIWDLDYKKGSHD
jgi:sucrose-6-phosphate hydrolase SacC (GH32 family)